MAPDDQPDDQQGGRGGVEQAEHGGEEHLRGLGQQLPPGQQRQVLGIQAIPRPSQVHDHDRLGSQHHQPRGDQGDHAAQARRVQGRVRCQQGEHDRSSAHLPDPQATHTHCGGPAPAAAVQQRRRESKADEQGRWQQDGCREQNRIDGVGGLDPAGPVRSPRHSGGVHGKGSGEQGHGKPEVGPPGGSSSGRPDYWGCQKDCADCHDRVEQQRSTTASVAPVLAHHAAPRPIRPRLPVRRAHAGLGRAAAGLEGRR